MAEKTRGERTVQLFAHLISNPDKSYSISNLMEVLQIPEGERRNVQRDMSFLVSMNNGAYIPKGVHSPISPPSRRQTACCSRISKTRCCISYSCNALPTSTPRQAN